MSTMEDGQYRQAIENGQNLSRHSNVDSFPFPQRINAIDAVDFSNTHHRDPRTKSNVMRWSIDVAVFD